MASLLAASLAAGLEGTARLLGHLALELGVEPGFDRAALGIRRRCI
jgi:hypothetical protein